MALSLSRMTISDMIILYIGYVATPFYRLRAIHCKDTSTTLTYWQESGL